MDDSIAIASHLRYTLMLHKLPCGQHIIWQCHSENEGHSSECNAPMLAANLTSHDQVSEPIINTG